MSQFDDLLHSSRETAAAAKARIQTSYGKAKAATGDLAAKGREQTQQLADKVAPVVAQGKEQAAKANSKLKSAAQDQPLTLLAGAAAVGALLGALLPKGRKSED
jgi:ElaB/YqjD/DUF883 family membrane-anchored ribosome-binding protein